MQPNVCFWMIRRKDTGEYYRPNKGPTWAKCGNWTKDMKRGKVYGGFGLAKASRTAYVGDYGKNPEIEIVRFRTFEEGVEPELGLWNSCSIDIKENGV